MTVPVQVTQWVDENYKKPRIDPEWLRDCYAWLTAEGGHNPNTNLPGLLDALEHQILESSFADSMLPGTGLPTYAAVPTTTVTLEGQQIRVEVVSITEIAHSAFNLNQTRLAREERMKAGDVDEGEGEGDIEVEGEGPIPRYPRGMLKFQLTDGTMVLPAIEYRPLPDLSLENTPLGYKMLLKNVSIRRGIAFLEPKCVTLLGHTTDERDENRLADFAKGLRLRMGLPEPEPAANAVPALNDQTRRVQPTVPEVRSPLRDISPPPSPPFIPKANDDEDLEPRRRRIPTRGVDARPGQGSSIAQYDGTKISPYFPTTHPSKSNQPDNVLETTEINVILPPKRREAQMPLFIASLPPPTRPEDEDFWANDGGSPIDAKRGVRLPKSSQREQEKDNGTGCGMEDLDFFEDDSMDFDPKFLEGLDTIEKEAYDRIVVPPPSSALASNSESSDKSCSSTAALPNTGRSVDQAIDVITIDEDDSGDAEDKENVPVPTRHVRRRTEDDVRGSGLGIRALSGSQRARNPGRPTILAKTASAVIDLSDSD